MPFALQESPTFENDVGELWVGENWKPSDDRFGHEVREIVFAEAIT